ncbi:ribulose-phosphate 3-epimerase [Sporolactobacillus pectinivorans]|uniref:ribulose-phosphate 3-epimerase n=1 Tax=Sporolactobacillus pectinivorans TaxID=1591408 RepID=UPI000C255F70|nr:ribulose-phosphate 3-epimerase [Sporolactobacillus pectinivorans]
MKKIAPSILNADITHLADEISSVERAGADYIHVDVMDGIFVPNITFGQGVVQALRGITSVPLDVHLMIADPDRYIQSFAQAGADIISVHAEACPHLHRTLQLIRESGAKAGVVLNPATPLSALNYVLNSLDLILIMTVNPGFGGQVFIQEMLEKIRGTHDLISRKNKEIEIEVDGGINVQTIKQCADAGADVFVVGSAIFKQDDHQEAINELRAKIDAE